MTKENSSRLHAFNIIYEFHSSSHQLKSIRRKYFKLNKTSINERNRSMVLTNEVVRWQRRLDSWISLSLDKPIKKLHPKLLCILRLGYYEYVMDDSVPPHAAVDSWVELSKKVVNRKLSGLINAVLRKASNIDKQTPIKDQNIASWSSFPDWMTSNWIDRFGEAKTKELFSYFNNNHETDIRLNIPIDEIKQKLASEDIKWSFSPNSKNFIRIKSGLRKILSDEIHFKGKVFVQDRAAGAVVEILNPQPGETVLDVCAAPGTKSIYIFHKMNQSGNLYSSDINSYQVKKGIQRCRELGLSINWNIMDATKDNFPLADRILIDAPCTGTGVISRKPDIKWRRDSEDSTKMSNYQKKILFHVSKFIKNDGVIVYSTCSIENQENWNVVESFLKLNSNFKLESIDSLVPKEWINKKNCLETFPPRDKVDGMFAVKMKKC